MKKTILSVVAIGSLIVLSGCSQPDSKKTYSANQKVYSCGAYEIILTGGSRTVHGVKEIGRDSTGFLTYKGTSERIAGSITIDSWAIKPHTTYLNSNGTFRMNKGATWSFRKMNKKENGKVVRKYFLAGKAYPKNRYLDGQWCERTH